MVITGLTAQGDEIILKASSVHINREYGVPADSAEITVAYSRVLPEFAGIRIEADGKTVFSGPVDVNEKRISNDGRYILIEARSEAGLLLDSESRPRVYNGATAGIIFENHIRPYGIKSFTGREIMLEGKISVTKGMNEWQTVREFCKKCYGSFPYFAPDSTVLLEGVEKGEETLFSNRRGGVGYTYAREIRRRCKLISGVYIKTADSQSYDRYVESREAREAGVGSVRYLDASHSSLTPMACAGEMLNLGEEEYYTAELSCPGRILLFPGEAARIEDSELGNIRNLFVSQVKYSRTQDGEKTVIRLKRRK